MHFMVNESISDRETKSIHTIPTNLNFLSYLQVDIYPEGFWGFYVNFLFGAQYLWCSNLEMTIAETKLGCCKQN